MVTKDEVVGAVEEFLAAVDEWNAIEVSEGHPLAVRWHGVIVKNVSVSVLAAFDSIFAYCAVDDAEDGAKLVILAIDDLRVAFADWWERSNIDFDSVHPSGPIELWGLVECLRLTSRPSMRPLPEPIDASIRAGVSDEQICKAYGFFKPNGSVDVRMLHEERITPGTHFNPKTWVHPVDRRNMRECLEKWKTRSPFVHTPTAHDDTPSVKREAPESIEDLAVSGVDVRQIAIIKRMTVDEVVAYCDANGVAVRGRVARSPHTVADEAAEEDQRQMELYHVSHPEIGDMEERIAACFLDDMKSSDIALALQRDYPNLTVQKVVALVRQFKKDDSPVAAS